MTARREPAERVPPPPPDPRTDESAAPARAAEGPSPVEKRHRVRTAFRILNVRLRFIILMVVTGIIAAEWDEIAARWERWTRPKDTISAAGAPGVAAVEYYCPMHPSVVRAEAGNCPICGMPLSKRAKGERETLPEGTIGRVQLSPYRMQLAGVGTSEVGFRPIGGELRTVGTVEVDERRVANVAARVGGRIERLFVDFTGERVERRAPLVEIYSPDLVTTQREYLIALRNYERLAEGSQARAQVAADAKSLLRSARERLRLWGVDDEQIAELESSGEPSTRMVVRSPVSGVVTRKNVLPGQYVGEGTELYQIADLSQVWVTASVYEDAIARIERGQRVEITSAGLADRVFEGTVSFVWPVLDRSSRTLRVRIDVPNAGGDLRPGMYVDARILSDAPSGAGGANAAAAGKAGDQAVAETWTCPMHPEIVRNEPGTCPICHMDLEKVVAAPSGSVLAVPQTAVIDTGTRKVVYLEREPGVFDAVEVELGAASADGWVPVLGGLSPGDRVVTSGAFLVDAEVRLNPGAAGSYFGASGGPNGGGAGPGGDGSGGNARGAHSH